MKPTVLRRLLPVAFSLLAAGALLRPARLLYGATGVAAADTEVRPPSTQRLPSLCSAGDPVPVTLAVDGLKMVRNLPVLLADRLGYFGDEGLAVTFKETSAGAAIDDMLVDGRIAGMAAYYHHTIVAQMDENKPMEAVVTLGVTPGYRVLVAERLKDRLAGPSDLKGRRIVSGGPHSAKCTSANWLVMHAGLATTDYTRLSTGDPARIAEELRNGEADFVIAPEPDAGSYLAQGVAGPFADLYSVEGTRRALGSLFPSTVLYMHPAYAAAHRDLAQRLVNALVRALKYINTHSSAEVRAQVPGLVNGDARDPSVLDEGVKMFATDGRMPAEAAAREAEVIGAQFPQYRGVKVDRTFTNEFVDKALAAGR